MHQQPKLSRNCKGSSKRGEFEQRAANGQDIERGNLSKELQQVQENLQKAELKIARRQQVRESDLDSMSR